VLEAPAGSYEGRFSFHTPESPDLRTAVVTVEAWDDAIDPNRGLATMQILIDICDDDESCDDGFSCNGIERCLDGWCEPGSEPDCSDAFDCTDDGCDERTGLCVHSPRDELCDDGLQCTGAEACSAEFGCVPGIALCDDDVSCTFDYCDEATGHCWSEPNDEICQDGTFCNGWEVCDSEVGCLSGAAPCHDGVECTVESCNEASESCMREPRDDLCEILPEPCSWLRCDLALGCVPDRTSEGPVGDRSCRDGLDTDCDTFIDADDADCTVPACATLVAPESVVAGVATPLAIDLCRSGLDPRWIFCQSERNLEVLVEERFEGVDNQLSLDGAARIDAMAQAPLGRGESGLRMCAPEATAESGAIDATGKEDLALRLWAHNDDMDEGTYLHAQVSSDGGVRWQNVLVLGDGPVGQSGSRHILLPPELDGEPDVRVRIVVEGARGCAFVDDVSLVDMPEVLSSTVLLSEDFSLGFGELLVDDPRGSDVYRVPVAGGWMAQVSGDADASIYGMVGGTTVSPRDRVALEMTFSDRGLGADGYALTELSLDRGHSWTVLLGRGLAEGDRAARLGAWLPVDAETIRDIRFRTRSPSTSVVALGEGIQIDDVEVRLDSHDFADRFSEFVALGDETYGTTLTADGPGLSTIRCAYRTSSYALWSEAHTIVVTP